MELSITVDRCYPTVPCFRPMWQRVSAVRLFIEHVCPPGAVAHPADIKSIYKLWKVYTLYKHSELGFMTFMPLLSQIRVERGRVKN